MSRQPVFPIQIFYDGSCSVCATEIEYYLSQDHGGRIIGVNIAAQDFNPEPFCIPLDRFMYELHAIDQTGEVFRGIEAFWAIWQAFPSSTVYGLLGSIIHMPVVNPVACMMYRGFAFIRPYLPKRHVCGSGTCSIGKKIKSHAINSERES
jgi:predicted DCC family thiol-disulfide oxidoreductase YuxK